MTKMQIDVWSDIACPWCYVGKARFEKAVAGFAHAEQVEVRHRSFELDPGQGIDDNVQVVPMLMRKYGMSEEQAREGEKRLGELAAAEGLGYRTEGRDHAGTFDIHRVLHLAAERGLSSEAWQAFYQANFADEASVFDRERVVEVAVEAGLDRDEVVGVLDDPEAYRDAVRADEKEAAAYGVNGVPFFLVDQKYGVSGAQPAELFEQLLEKAWGEREPQIINVAGAEGATSATPAEPSTGGVCGPDGCDV